MHTVEEQAEDRDDLRSKEKIKRYLDAEITKLFTGILDYAEVAIDSEERWKVLRSRILKLSNDSIREIRKEIDERYTVSYRAPGEDIIIVKTKVS